MRIAYLVSRYPAVSHTFIAREVAALRARGIALQTMSIRRATPDHVLTQADREAYESTIALLPASPCAFVRAHVRALRRCPSRYVRTLFAALRTGTGLRGKRKQVTYFAGAVLVLEHCRRLRISHLHAHFERPSADVAMLASLLSTTGESMRELTWSFTAHLPAEYMDDRSALSRKVMDAAMVVCVSHFGRSQLMALVPDAQWTKLVVVRCGLTNAELECPSRCHAARDPAEVVMVARFDPIKGHAVLLHALSRLRRRGVEVTANLVGFGPMVGRLVALADELAIGDRVNFVGPVAADQVADFYARSVICCLPSFGEGVPVALMEAMAIGLPTIASRIMGIPELVEDNVTGLLVTPGRDDELADAIELLLGNPAMRQAYGQAGRQKVRNDYSIEIAAARLHQLFDGIMTAASNGSSRHEVAPLRAGARR